MLRRIGFAAFCYAGIGIAEGIGLYLEKAWGEYLTLVITASFLPLEIMEILRRHTMPRSVCWWSTLLVLLYLSRLVWSGSVGPNGSNVGARTGDLAASFSPLFRLTPSAESASRIVVTRNQAG